MDDDVDIIGLDLLMNPKKRSSSAGSSVSSSNDVIKIADHHSVRSSRKSKSTKSSSSASSSSSSASSSSSGSSSSGSGSGTSSYSSSCSSMVPKKKLSQEDIINMKKELLYQFDRLEKKGIKLPKKFTLSSSLDEMKVEYDRLKKDREVDVSVKFQKRCLMTFITGLEFLNKKFDPFDVDLDGWSENVNDGLTDYDDIFEELHEKYKGKANLPTEVKLMFALGGSAFMFHLQKTTFKSNLPGIDDVMGKQQQRKQKASSGGGGGLGGILGNLMGGGGGLGGLLGNLMGGMGGGGSRDEGPPPQPRTQMRGPTNVDDILSELNAQNRMRQQQQSQQHVDDRVEMMSTISESEYSEIPDDESLFTQKKTGKRTLNL